MKPQLTQENKSFIKDKQKAIHEKVLKKRELKDELDKLLGEIEFLDSDIECYRYSIRKMLGRS